MVAAFDGVDKRFQSVVEAVLHPVGCGHHRGEAVVTAQHLHPYVRADDLLHGYTGNGHVVRVEEKCVNRRHRVYPRTGVNRQFLNRCCP